MDFEEGLFHCPRCLGKYDLEHNDIVGVEDENGFSDIICEPCYIKMKKEVQNEKVN